jgi:hypothetical protein
VVGVACPALFLTAGGLFEVRTILFCSLRKTLLYFQDILVMPRKSIFLLSFPLPLTAVTLGRLVDEPRTPAQGFFDPSDKIPSTPKPTILESHVDNISRLLASGKNANFELTLSAFASTFLKGEHKDVRQLTARVAKQYLLSNSEEWFDEICSFQQTRLWLERAAMRGRRTYLVTGLQTLTNVSVHDTHSNKFGTGGSIQAPLLAAAGIPLPGPLNPGLSAKTSISRDVKDNYKIPDEMIYSVQYREVKLKKGETKQLSEAKLTSKTWWEQICSDRSGGDLDEEDDTVIIADMLDIKETPPGLEEGGEEGEDTYFLEMKPKE